MRPLWVEFPKDANTYGIQSSFLAGGDLLVTPVSSSGQTSVYVYLPGQGRWEASGQEGRMKRVPSFFFWSAS
jgi:alpha-glucosidase (family GH31 glycosyl hydrolase)